MIFDDHEVHDDWNISDSWIAEMRAKTWWHDRITGAFMAYFLYQHLGNLSPPELAAEPLFQELQGDDDGGPRLRERARLWDEDRGRVGGRTTATLAVLDCSSSTHAQRGSSSREDGR